MAHWNVLPEEILETILYHLKSKDAAQCQLTCHNWEKASQRALYSYVNINNIAQMTSLVDTMSSSSSCPGKFVKHLLIHNNFSTDEWAKLDCIAILVECCPNLEKLEMPTSSSPFYIRVMQEFYEGNWKHFDTLQYPNKKEEIGFYNCAVLAMRRKVKRIIICDSLSFHETPTHNNQFDVLINRLKEFESLTKLDIRKHTNKSLPEFGEMLNTCPQLKDLSITLYPVQGEIHMDTVIPKEMKNITQLRLELVIFSEDILYYVMNKFPNVKILTINFGCDDLSSHLQECPEPFFTVDKFEAFTKYVKDMDYFFIDYFFAQNLGEVARIWQINLVGGQLDIDLCFENSTTLDNIGVDYVSNGTSYMRLTTCVGSHLSKFLDVIQEAGSILTGLNVELEKIYVPTLLYQNEAIRNMAYGYYLDDIFTFCVNMKKIVMENTTIVMCRPEADTNISIETLKFNQVQYYPPILFELSARLPNLKYLTITNCNTCNQEGRLVRNRDNYFIDMPYSSIDRMCFQTKIIGVFYFYLKLYTMRGSHIYYCSKTSISRTSYNAFDSASDDINTLTLYIQCKSLKEIRVSSARFDCIYTLPIS